MWLQPGPSGKARRSPLLQEHDPKVPSTADSVQGVVPRDETRRESRIDVTDTRVPSSKTYVQCVPIEQEKQTRIPDGSGTAETAVARTLVGRCPSSTPTIRRPSRSPVGEGDWKEPETMARNFPNPALRPGLDPLVDDSYTLRPMARLLGFFIVLTLLSVPVSAQSKLDPPDPARYRKWGALRVRPGLELSGVGYDNNILRGTDRGSRIGDYTATLSPKVDILGLMGHSAFLTFRQRFDYTVYANYLDQNFLNNYTSARFTIPFDSHFGVFVEGRYRVTHNRPPDLERARPRQDRLNFGYGVILEPGWRTAIEIAGTMDQYEYKDSNIDPAATDSIARRLNRSEYGISLDAGYKVMSRTRVLFSGFVRRVDFDSSITIEDYPLPGEQLTLDRDSFAWRALAGLEFGRAAPLVGLIRIGWEDNTPEDPRIQKLSIPIGDAVLAYRLNSSTRFELRGDRLPGFAVYGANSYYLLSQVEFRAIYFVLQRLSLEAAAGTGRLTFPASLNLLEREDDLNRYELGIRLIQAEDSMGKRVEYSMTIRYTQRRSSVPSLDRSDTFVGFGAVFGY